MAEALVEKSQEAAAGEFLSWSMEHPELCRSIQIMIPIRPGEGLPPELAKMLSIWSMAGIAWRDTSNPSAGFIEAVRAGMAWTFVSDPFHADQRFLIMIDSDMIPAPEDVWLPVKLAQHDRPIVGGCALTLSRVGPSLCFTVKDAAGDWRFPVMSGPENKMPKFGLIDVGHTGCGIMCIRRDVLEAFSWKQDERDGIPFFVPDDVRKLSFKDGIPGRGEDLEFCAQARRKGYTVHVDLDCHIGHRKPALLRWFENLRDAEMNAQEWVVPAEGILIRREFD